MLCPHQKIRDGGGRKNHPQPCRGCTPNMKTIKKRKKNMSNINLYRFVKLHSMRQEAGINCYCHPRAVCRRYSWKTFRFSCNNQLILLLIFSLGILPICLPHTTSRASTSEYSKQIHLAIGPILSCLFSHFML